MVADANACSSQELDHSLPRFNDLNTACAVAIAMLCHVKTTTTNI